VLCSVASLLLSHSIRARAIYSRACKNNLPILLFDLLYTHKKKMLAARRATVCGPGVRASEETAGIIHGITVLYGDSRMSQFHVTNELAGLIQFPRYEFFFVF
jgi:hypothetical protein